MAYLNLNLKSYNRVILRQVQPGHGVSVDAMILVNSLQLILAKEIIAQSNILLTQSGKTVSSKGIRFAVGLALNGALAKHAISEGTKAVTRWTLKNAAKVPGVPAEKISMTKKAGLTLSAPRMRPLLVALSTSPRITKTSLIFLAAVLEYIAAEIFELAGHLAHDNHLVRITTKHVLEAIRNDAELNSLFPEDKVIVGGKASASK